jgi:polyribonucleotide nucleotidyltransferase
MAEVREVVVEKEIGGRKLILKTGKLGKQAAGSVWVQYGDTVVFVAVVTAAPRMPSGWFPLYMDYREKQYAAGKVPRGFFKREGKPTDKETLVMRLMDRPLRPLFPDGFTDEVQVQAIVLSFDQENESDVLAMIGASACVAISSIPFNGPVGSVRVGRVGGQFVINPTMAQMAESDLEVVMSGVDDTVCMIEVGANVVSEDDLAAALAFGSKYVAEITEMQRELMRLVGTQKTWTPPEPNTAAIAAVAKFDGDIRQALTISGKLAQNQAIADLEAKAVAEFVPEGAEGLPYDAPAIAAAFGELKKSIIRERILSGIRPDGRSIKQIRPLSAEVGLLPRTHGSALFTRGETQALVTTTLGTYDDQQIIDGLAPEYRKRFMLQYNFPPFSVGEVKPIRGPSRRDIGHGNLAEKCVAPVMPSLEQFAYTVLAVSEILESNGSSSMATVCGCTLALMDAGVPIADPVAGISIGLVQEGSRHVLLTDIQGAEDHYGDMDFKVAGTQKGVTGVQLDMKVGGITHNVIRETLAQAREGRLELLKMIVDTIPAPRAEISRYAPRLLFVKIDPDKIGKLIGPGGKTIKGIQEATGARIEVDDDGNVMISCVDVNGAEAAKQQVELLTEEIGVGKVYTGKVVGIKEFGAFVELTPGQDGMCHISELSDQYVKNVEDAVKMGDMLTVKVIAVDPTGRVKLSRKAVINDEKRARGEPVDETPSAPRSEGGHRSGGGDRGGRRGGGDRDRRGGGSRGGHDREHRAE